VQSLLVQDGRDPEARFLDEEFLDGVGQFRRLARVVLVPRPRDLADPVRHQLARLRGREQSGLAVVDSGALPVHRLELCDLLGGRHAPEQIGQARVDGPLCITVGQWSCGLREHDRATKSGDNNQDGGSVSQSHGRARYTATGRSRNSRWAECGKEDGRVEVSES